MVFKGRAFNIARLILVCSLLHGKYLRSRDRFRFTHFGFVNKRDGVYSGGICLNIESDSSKCFLVHVKVVPHIIIRVYISFSHALTSQTRLSRFQMAKVLLFVYCRGKFIIPGEGPLVRAPIFTSCSERTCTFRARYLHCLHWQR